MNLRLLLMLCLSLCLTTAVAAEPAMVIPKPWLVTTSNKPAMPLKASTALRVIGSDVRPIAEWLRLELTIATGVTMSEPQNSAGDGIVLMLDPMFSVDAPDWAQAEAYRVTIAGSRTTITARTSHGLFYGACTLVQLAQQNGGDWQIPAMEITDRPRFRWRGLMLDCGRHFFSVDEVKRFIDLLAVHKFNRFHWHLTEDQGWRIEVKSKPKLTSIGAWRAESPVMGENGKGDGQPYGGFYTQDDIRTVVAYAASRFVTVVPEIEMPGHSVAAVASYPELGNNDIPSWEAPTVGTRWGVAHRTLSPKEETFAFIAQVFDEILPLFPGEYVHIGGDEAPKDEWKKSPFAQKVIKQNNLADEHGLQSWFIKRVENLLKERGKRMIGWDEIQEGGLSPSATMMVWRDWKWAKLALDSGNTVVMAPTSHTYFDYRQSDTPEQPGFQTIGGGKWKPTLDTAKVFTFEPIPAEANADQAEHILGAQGQVWTEYIWSRAKVEYMTWPRACALAEAVWSPKEDRSWEEFQERLARHLTLLDKAQVNYRKSDGSPTQPMQSMERTPRKP
jgi:hexosaminidase